MKYCIYCGKEIEDGAAFCKNCGAKAEDNPQNTQFANENIPEFTSEGFDKADIDDSKIFALLSYLGILFLVPVLAKPDSPYARFHANQGIILFIFEFILGAICAIPIVGWIVGGIGEIAAVVFTVMGIINAVSGEAKELPLIGKYRILK